MNAIEAYLLARAYTNQALEGAGALKGAACQIKSITSITGGHRVTFEWEDDEGESSTETMDVMDGTNGIDGDDGVGIASITYKEMDVSGNYVYTVTLTDSNSYDITCPKGPQGSTGQTGATGNGIVSIEKTSTVGLVDTYTITYTNGTTSTFTVTNGQNGENEFIGTTAEWNALTTAQKKEYDTYQLTDDYTEGKYIYLPTIYSEEERQVGVWEDGKPLYQKTIDCGALPNSTTKQVASGLSGVEIKSIFGIASYQDNSFIPLPFTPGDNVNERLMLQYDDSNGYILIRDMVDFSDYTKSCVTLQYTKKSDTAGSGTWTPTGQYAEHYSTDEQIIGTWVDGKTLYRRLVEFETDVTIDGNGWGEHLANINGETLTRAIAYNSVNYNFPVGGGFNNGELEILNIRNSQIAINRVLIEYTKTA